MCWCYGIVLGYQDTIGFIKSSSYLNTFQVRISSNQNVFYSSFSSTSLDAASPVFGSSLSLHGPGSNLLFSIESPSTWRILQEQIHEWESGIIAGLSVKYQDSAPPAVASRYRSLRHAPRTGGCHSALTRNQSSVVAQKIP